jgi:putative ABC transport system permease protein
VVSRTAIDAGLRLGDTLTVDRVGTKLSVVGVMPDQHTFGHVDVGLCPAAYLAGDPRGDRPG